MPSEHLLKMARNIELAKHVECEALFHFTGFG